MPPVMSRGDSLYEFLTGSGSDGGVQTNPFLSFGNYRSSTEAVSYGIQITGTPISNVSVDFASGGCAAGSGSLIYQGNDSVTWQDAESSAGDPLSLPGNGSTGIAESAGNASSFVRLTRTSSSPLSGGPANIILTPIVNNIFGFDNVTSSQASSGEDEYLASIVKNMSGGTVSNFKRWISTLGTRQTTSTGLGASGSGTISITGSFGTWPSSGYCRVQTSSGTLREIVYYSSRTSTVLTVPATGRGILGSSAAAGALNDTLDAVPGIALALDTNGVQAAGSPILTIAGISTAPAGVTWKTGILQSTGISIGNMTAGQQIGIWMWRHIPAGAIAAPLALNMFNQSFDAF